MLERLKQLAKFQYCKVTKLNDCDSFELGWKDGLHFYLDDYYYNDEYEGQYILVVWLDKKMIFNKDFREIEPLIEKIKEIVNENSNHI